MKSIQLKMARAAVGWGVRELAERSGVTANTVTRIENGADAKHSTIAALQSALEQAGVHFLKSGDVARGEGVALSTRDVSAPASQEDMDASADDARSQAAGAADSAMVGMDASKAEKTSRRKRLTDAPAGTKDATRNNGDE